jgi:hypothetical protein
LQDHVYAGAKKGPPPLREAGSQSANIPKGGAWNRSARLEAHLGSGIHWIARFLETSFPRWGLLVLELEVAPDRGARSRARKNEGDGPAGPPLLARWPVDLAVAALV